MKLELKHPWWTHAPALCLLVIAAFLAAMPMPDRVPIHFAWNGKPDGWGSPLELRSVFVGLPLLIFLVSFVIDELYCKFESRKQFNFLAMFDDGIIGFLVGLESTVVMAISSGSNVIRGDVTFGLEIAIAAMAFAAVLELLRKRKPSPETEPCGKAHEPSAEELASMSDENWLHCETQNPLYLRLLIVASLAIPAPVIADDACPRWIALPMLCIVVLLFMLIYGGMRVSVTQKLLTVRFGIFHIPVLKLPLEEVVSATARSFNPIADFGGWGIKYCFSNRMWVYFLYGSRGVVLKTASGKSYVIGSDDADKLAAIFQAALRLKREKAI